MGKVQKKKMQKELMKIREKIEVLKDRKTKLQHYVEDNYWELDVEDHQKFRKANQGFDFSIYQNICKESELMELLE